MNPIRDAIFKNIRTSLKRQELNAETVQKLKEHLAAHTIYEQPTLKEDLVTQFFMQLEKVGGTKDTISSLSDLPFAVLEFLQHQNLPMKKVVVDAHLADIPWPQKLQVTCQAAQADDVTSVSNAFAGVAETGSVVLLSSARSPTTLNFLPENHIVLLERENLVAHIEEVWKKLRLGSMPRAVNFITGPSRTADIEQTIQKGAHGPRRLHIVLLKTRN